MAGLLLLWKMVTRLNSEFKVLDRVLHIVVLFLNIRLQDATHKSGDAWSNDEPTHFAT
jgi:hypothetical protein